MMNRSLVNFIISMMFLTSLTIAYPDDEKIDYKKAIKKIAHSISALKDDYPQLKKFDVKEHLDEDKQEITYEYKTHTSRTQGGWTSGVPNPDKKGIWFYIDFHDPNSTRQIHMQPMIREMNIGAKRVSFLILEGKKTKHLGGIITKILMDSGVKFPGKKKG